MGWDGMGWERDGIIYDFLKVMEIAGAISVSVVYSSWSSSGYYNFVAVTGIVVAMVLIFLNMIRVTTKFERIPWSFGVWALDFVDLLFDGALN